MHHFIHMNLIWLQVSESIAQEFAREKGMIYFETSSFKTSNIKEIFLAFARPKSNTSDPLTTWFTRTLGGRDVNNFYLLYVKYTLWSFIITLQFTYKCLFVEMFSLFGYTKLCVHWKSILSFEEITTFYFHLIFSSFLRMFVKTNTKSYSMLL